MRLIFNKSNHAPVNLATEEFLLKHFHDDIIYLYINSPCIIVGRKQNTLSQVNYEYITKNDIPVVRRLSGGGAVFHDMGNLNFCFIVRNIKNKEHDFIKYTMPIINFLQSLSVNAVLEGRNDLTINGKKFSGNAKYFSHKNMLQHGTILFSSSLGELSKALKVDPSKFNDKAVKSIQARVTNIYEHLPTKMNISEFTDRLIKFINADYYELNSDDIQCIDILVKQKYDTWDWNYGTSPKYNYTKTIRTTGGTLQVEMMVNQGKICNLKFYGDFFSKQDIDIFEKYFENYPHSVEKINNLLTDFPASDFFININNDYIINVLF